MALDDANGHEADTSDAEKSLAADEAGKHDGTFKWPGICGQCGRKVKADEIERGEGRPPLHRVRKNRMDLVGVMCGPVATAWRYHVAFVLQTTAGTIQFVSKREITPCPMEEAGAIEHMEALLLQSVVVPDGVPPPTVTILSWQLLEAR